MDEQDDPIFALRQAAAGIAVRIMDLSGGNGSDPVEVVRGFGSLGHANTFARRYVRDSVERCRARGMNTEQVMQAWFTFGEDAVVHGAEPGAWRSESELRDFAGRALEPGSEQRDWRALDPRRDAEDGDADELEDEA